MKTKNEISEKFASIMIKKMEEMKAEKWEQPWFDVTGKINFFPQNLTGRKYTSGNAFFLLIACAWASYRTPVFLTFNQCKTLGVKVKKGEASFPIYYKNYMVKHRETGEKMLLEDFNLLIGKDKEDWQLIPFLKYYNVFNLDQTNYETVRSEEFEKFMNRYNIDKEAEIITESEFTCDSLDSMILNNAWVCDISIEKQNRAYFSLTKDLIVCPLKKQFPNQHNFYGTLLHEMTHSTGTPERLDRTMGNMFGDNDYAREEVIAELTAAFAGSQLGIFAEPSKESVTYLNGWIGILKESPEFVFKLLDDVVRASNFIMEQVSSNNEKLKKVAS